MWDLGLEKQKIEPRKERITDIWKKVTFPQRLEKWILEELTLTCYEIND